MSVSTLLLFVACVSAAGPTRREDSVQNEERWKPPGSDPITSLDVGGADVLVTSGGSLWRCRKGSPDCERMEGPAGKAMVVSTGEGGTCVIAWDAEDKATLYRERSGSWEAIATETEPRALAAGVYTDTDNRLHLLGGVDLGGDPVANLRASGTALLARRTSDDAIVRATVGAASPTWKVVSPGPARMPAGFLADGTPIVVDRAPFEKGGTAPTQDLATPEGRVVASVTGLEIHVHGGTLGYVETDAKGRVSAIVRKSIP